VIDDGTADGAKMPSDTNGEHEASKDVFPGVAGSHAIPKAAKVPEALLFGEVQQKLVEDGVALRAQLQAHGAAA
jgi:hypothetical protein